MNALRIVCCTLVFLLLFGSLESGLPWAVLAALAVNETLVFADRLLIGKGAPSPAEATRATASPRWLANRWRRAVRLARFSTRVQLAFRR